MVDKIEGGSGQQPPIPSAGTNAKPGAVDIDSRAPEHKQSDQISLTSSAQLFRELSELIDAAPSVDRARVDAIKQALANGQYEVSSSRIAEQLLALDKVLDDAS